MRVKRRKCLIIRLCLHFANSILHKYCLGKVIIKKTCHQGISCGNRYYIIKGPLVIRSDLVLFSHLLSKTLSILVEQQSSH